jgi:uncharacterized membrane protein YbhN (UPF0104 family)
MQRSRRLLAIPLWLLLAAGLLGLALRDVPLTSLEARLGGVAWAPLLLAVLVDWVCVSCKAFKWQQLLRPVGRVSLLRLQGAIYAGGAAATLLPFRLDEGVRVFLAARLTGLPVPSLLGSMTLERLVDASVLLAVLAALAVLLPLPPWLGHGALVVSALALLLLLGLALGLLGQRRGWLGGGAARWLVGFAEGGRALRRPRLLLGAVLITALEWALTAGVIQLVAVAAGVQLPVVGLVLVVALLFGSFALPLAPAGIGVFQVACGLVLPPLFGLEPVEAVTLALLVHGVVLVAVVTVGSGVISAAGVGLGELDRVGRDGLLPPAEGQARR